MKLFKKKFKTPTIDNPGEWLVVIGNRVVGKFKSYARAMKRSAKNAASAVVSRKSWVK